MYIYRLVFSQLHQIITTLGFINTKQQTNGKQTVKIIKMTNEKILSKY